MTVRPLLRSAASTRRRAFGASGLSQIKIVSGREDQPQYLHSEWLFGDMTRNLLSDRADHRVVSN